MPFAKKPRNADEAEFAQWWVHYPLKIARGEALVQWVRKGGVRPSLPEMIAAVQRYVGHLAALENAGKFVPQVVYPERWLKGERWADVFDTRRAAPASQRPEPSPEELAEATARRMAYARAAAAWMDVLDAHDARSMPLGGFPDARTGQVLAAIGGWTAIDAARKGVEVQRLKDAFVAAYVREGASSGKVTILTRTSHAK